MRILFCVFRFILVTSFLVHFSIVLVFSSPSQGILRQAVNNVLQRVHDSFYVLSRPHDVL
jgi:hypothetical protein